MLIVYYSLGGNTSRIAEMIQEATGADTARIETCHPYTGSYDGIVEQGQREIDEGYLPEIERLDASLKGHETIILGSPVWWYELAPAMRTFLRDHDLQGKDVYPFITNGGWPGRAFEDYENRCTGAKIHQGLDVRFNESTLRTAESAIRGWAEGIEKR